MMEFSLSALVTNVAITTVHEGKFALMEYFQFRILSRTTGALWYVVLLVPQCNMIYIGHLLNIGLTW